MKLITHSLNSKDTIMENIIKLILEFLKNNATDIGAFLIPTGISLYSLNRTNKAQKDLETLKSELRQEEIQSEAKLKTRGALLAFDEVKNVSVEVATVTLQQAFPNTAYQEIENAVKSMQLSNLPKDTDPRFFSTTNDWFREFIKLSGKFSSDDAHKLWGNILEKEVEQQGSVSYRTMMALAELTPEECKAFQSLFPYIIDKMYIFPEYIIDNSDKYQDFYNKILIPLEETGLIKFVSSPMTISINYASNQVYDGFTFRTFFHSLTVKRNKTSDHRHYMLDFPTLRSVDLTQIGKELYLALRIKTFSEDDSHKSKQYLENIVKYIKRESAPINIESKINSVTDEYN